MRKGFWGLCLALALGLWATVSAAAPPLETYGKLPSLEKVTLSPSGDRIAFIAVDGEHRRVFVRQVGGEAIAVSEVGQSKIWSLNWGGEDYLVILGSGTVVQGNGIQTQWKNTAKAEVLRGMVLNLKTKAVHQIFENHHEVFYQNIFRDYGTRFVGGHWIDVVTAIVAHPLCFVNVDLETNGFNCRAFNQYPSILSEHFVDENAAIAAGAAYDQATRTWTLYAGSRLTTKVVSWPSTYNDIDIIGPGRTPPDGAGTSARRFAG